MDLAIFDQYFFELDCLLLISYLKSWQSFAKLLIISKSSLTICQVLFLKQFFVKFFHYLVLQITKLNLTKKRLVMSNKLLTPIY